MTFDTVNQAILLSTLEECVGTDCTELCGEKYLFIILRCGKENATCWITGIPDTED